MTKRLLTPMTNAERGSKGGLVSGHTRHLAKQQKARNAALASLEANAQGLHIAPQLAAWVRSGVLDPWILGIFENGYRGGITARWTARRRREAQKASEAA